MHGEISKSLSLRLSGTISPTSYSYYFATSHPSYRTGASGYQQLSSGTYSNYSFNSAHFVNVSSQTSTHFTAASSNISSVANVGFTAGTSTAANIVISGVNRTLYVNDTAHTQVAGFTVPTTTTSGNNAASDIILTSAGLTDTMTRSYVATHELGHAVGLADAAAVTSWTATERSQYFTIMTPLAHQGFTTRVAHEYQLYDIAALQAKYGRNDAVNSGNTVHSTFNETVDSVAQARIWSLWDGGGTDTIDASAQTAAVFIDLRPGYFSSVGLANAFSMTANVQAAPTGITVGAQNMSIAFGAYIENAAGTAQNDLIIGNILSNSLVGGAGNDAIYAEGISAAVDPGNGDYRRIITTGTNLETAPTAVNNNVLNPALQSDTLIGGAGDDYLMGGRGNDRLEGGDGNDRLEGGAGKDMLFGGAEGDLILGGDGNDYIDNGGSDPLATFSPYVDSAEGGAGNDIIIMRASNDTAVGGAGADQFWVVPAAKSANPFVVMAGHSILDSDPTDTLYWKGYQITGGTAVIIDAEWTGPNSFQATSGAVDAKGIRYDWNDSAGDLYIYLPGGTEFIYVKDYINGDLGIVFDRSHRSYVNTTLYDEDGNIIAPSFDIPFSNISFDGIWLDYQNLAGAATTLANPGPLPLPMSPLP